MGIWVAIMPFLNFPINIRNILYVVTGITIFIAAYLYLRKRIAIAKDTFEPTFIEAKPQHHGSTSHSHVTAPQVDDSVAHE